MIEIEKIANNFTKVKINRDVTFWFSYETCIAFNNRHTGEMIISKNYWGTTTGTHLNMIDTDKSKRIPNFEFNPKMENLNFTFNK